MAEALARALARARRVEGRVVVGGPQRESRQPVIGSQVGEVALHARTGQPVGGHMGVRPRLDARRRAAAAIGRAPVEKVQQDDGRPPGQAEQPEEDRLDGLRARAYGCGIDNDEVRGGRHV